MPINDLVIEQPGGEIKYPQLPISGTVHRVIGSIGRGGYGKVYKALPVSPAHPGINQAKAVKQLSPKLRNTCVVDYLKNAFFIREKLSGTLGQMLVPYYDYDLLARFGLLASEFVEGQTLKGFLEGTLRVDEFIKIYHWLAEFGGRLQDEGLVHLDIKPENLIVRNDEIGGLCAIDNDLLSYCADRDDGSPAAQKCAGTISYCAPEMVRWEGVRPTTDMPSIGTIGIKAVERLDPHKPKIVFLGDDYDDESLLALAKARGAFFGELHEAELMKRWCALPDNEIKTRAYGAFLHIIACMQDDPSRRPYGLAETRQLLAEKPPMEV